MGKESTSIVTSEKARADAMFFQQADLLKEMKSLKSKVDVLQAERMEKGMPESFMDGPEVLSFNDHLRKEKIRGMDEWDEMVTLNMATQSESETMISMSKALVRTRAAEESRREFRKQPEYKSLQKAMRTGSTMDVDKAVNKFESMAKSILGGPNSGGEAGSVQAWLQENLSTFVQEIILTSADCQMTQSVATAITPSINPEVPVLESTGSGYGKGTLGFNEGGTPNFGGGSIKTRIAKTLVQRGIRASVTQMLQANRGKIVAYDPLAAERRERIIERNLMINHLLIYGDDQINKNGTEIQEMSGFVQQLENSDFNVSNVRDWDGKALTDANDAIDIFRDAAETMIKIGKLPGGIVTGKFTCLLDYGVANQLSKIIDPLQRTNLEKYDRLAAMYYGQAFAGVHTDLGVFNFKRTRTLELVQDNTWTETSKVSKLAITWPAIAPTAIPEAGGGTVAGSTKFMRTGNYTYRFTAVNDHGESDVSDAIVTTSNGTIPVAVAASERTEISIPYDAVFGGGLVGGFEKSPVRYFIIYRGAAEATADAELFPIAKVAINGTSTTTFLDFDQKLPNHTDILFICKNPLDIAHTSLIPPKELNIWDPKLVTTTQWTIFDIANLTMWAPQRQFLVKNVPGGVKI